MLILLNIPLALVGGVVALWISGQNLSVPASVGFIALFGIALENGMVLVTYLNQLVKGGVPVAEAIIRAASGRLRAVLMTAATTALGLLPLLLATGNRQRGPATPRHGRHRRALHLDGADPARAAGDLSVVQGGEG